MSALQPLPAGRREDLGLPALLLGIALLVGAAAGVASVLPPEVPASRSTAAPHDGDRLPASWPRTAARP
ncbi:hypothetical protein NUM3379_29470 [Kineococcus sp. NUM-3379]